MGIEQGFGWRGSFAIPVVIAGDSIGACRGMGYEAPAADLGTNKGRGTRFRPASPLCRAEA